MSRTLIIGGAGFIGGRLAEALVGDGERVDILDDFSRGIHDPFVHSLEARGARLMTGDVLDPATTARLGDDYAIVYQFAAIVGVRHVLERPFDVLDRNVAIQARALELAHRQRFLERFVFSSTSEVYAGSLEHLRVPVPTPETVPLALPSVSQPRTSYLLSKIYGEAMCHHAGLPFTIVRPHNVYGARMGLVHVLPELMKKCRELPAGGELAVASVNHRRAFCHVDDAVELLRRLARAPEARGGTFNIGNGDEELSIGEVARLVARTVGRPDVPIVALPETPGSPPRRCPDMTRTTSVTGYRARVPLEEGLRRMYSWYERNVFVPSGASAT